MNKNYIFVAAILAVIMVVIGYLYVNKTRNNTAISSDALWQNYTIKQVEIEGTAYNLIVADTPERWQKGLMFVRKPVTEFDGMIFIFPTYEYHRFWNMNTFENLTLYWMKDEEVVGKSDLPSIEKSKDIVRVSSPEAVNIVVEIIQ